MNQPYKVLVIAALLSAASQTMANEPPANAQSADSSTTSNEYAAPAKSNQQMMKECMAKQKAANNGMSAKDMQKSCRDQIKANVDQPNKEPVVPAH